MAQNLFCLSLSLTRPRVQRNLSVTRSAELSLLPELWEGGEDLASSY